MKARVAEFSPSIRGIIRRSYWIYLKSTRRTFFLKARKVVSDAASQEGSELVRHGSEIRRPYMVIQGSAAHHFHFSPSTASRADGKFRIISMGEF